MKTSIVVLTIFALVLVAPLAIQGFDYVSMGTDSESHLETFNNFEIGKAPRMVYLGQVIVGFPLKLLEGIINIEHSFLLFQFLALVSAMAVLFFVVTKLVNKEAGLLVIPIAFFCTQGMLTLFSFGIIFNIINMYIILPLAFLFAIRWWLNRKGYQAVLAVCLFLLFSTFHSTALYLPYAIGLLITVFIAYKLIKKDKAPLLKYVPFGLLFLVLSLVVSRFTLPTLFSLQALTIQSVTGGTSISPPAYPPPTLTRFMFAYLSPATLAILGASAIGLYLYRKRLEWTQETKLFLVALSCFAVVLIPGAFIAISPDPARLALDLATILAIITACLAGKILSLKRTKPLMIGTFAIIATSMIPVLSLWFQRGVIPRTGVN